MGYEAYDRAEKKYRADIRRLDKIAHDVYYDDHRSFVTSLANTWMTADPSEKRILREAWAAIVTKYSLEAEAEE